MSDIEIYFNLSIHLFIHDHAGVRFPGWGKAIRGRLGGKF